MNLRPPNQEELQAYCDGELSPEQSEWIAAYLQKKSEALAFVEDQQKQDRDLRVAMQALDSLPFNPRLDPSSIRAQLYLHRRRFMRLSVAFLFCFFLGGSGGWYSHDLTLAFFEPPMEDAVIAYRMVAEQQADLRSRKDQLQPFDQAQLTSWFLQHYAKADYPPDLSSYGWAASSLQQIPTSQGMGVMVVYEMADHQTLVFFVRPPGRLRGALKAGSRKEGDIQAHYWSDQHYNYALVSRADLSEIPALRQLARQSL